MKLDPSTWDTLPTEALTNESPVVEYVKCDQWHTENFTLTCLYTKVFRIVPGFSCNIIWV